MKSAHWIAGRPIVSHGQVATQLSETNAIILIDEMVVAILTPEDVKSIKGESLGSLANGFASRLQLAVTEARELGDHRQLARSGLAVGGATALLVLVIMFWVRKRADLEDWLIRAGVKATSEVKSGTIKTLSRQNLVGTVRALVGVLMWTTIVVGGFLWLEFTLKAFPITRPVGEQLGREVIGALLGMGHSLIRSLPDTGVLVVIWLLARFVSASVRRSPCWPMVWPTPSMR